MQDRAANRQVTFPSTNAKKILFRLTLLALLLILPLFLGRYYLRVLNMALIDAIVVLGANYITGLTGVVVLGLAGLVAIGAYTSALLSTRLGLSPWMGLLASVPICSLFGYFLGRPSLRVKGIYLTITTIAFGEIVRIVFANWEDLTGGTRGVRGIPYFRVGPWMLQSDVQYFYLILTFVLLATYVSVRISGSKFGRAFRSVRDNELASEAMGLDSTWIKTLAFILCSIYAGVAGALYSHLMRYISPFDFDFDLSVRYIGMLIVGGMGRVPGAIAGAVLLDLLQEWLRRFQEYYMLAFGTLLMLTVVMLPQGVVSVFGKRTGESWIPYSLQFLTLKQLRWLQVRLTRLISAK